MSYNPFAAIQYLQETAAGVHAIQDSMPIDAQLHLKEAYTALEEVAQTWVEDLYLRLCKQISAQSKKDFYSDTVSKVLLACNSLSEIDASSDKIVPLLAYLKKSQEEIQYYIDHNSEIISEQRSNPDIKAKFIAYFGDRLAS